MLWKESIDITGSHNCPILPLEPGVLNLLGNSQSGQVEPLFLGLGQKDGLEGWRFRCLIARLR
jgi:hypothetical protein